MQSRVRRGLGTLAAMTTILAWPAPLAAADSIAPAVATTPFTTSNVIKQLERSGATRIQVHGWSSAGSSADMSARLPLDTFSVSTMWADYWKDGKKHIVFYGRWAFKSGYIGSGEPDDASAMRVTGFPMKCWTKVRAGVRTTNELGQRTYLSYRKSDGHASSIWAVQDRTRSFQLENRYGLHWIDMRRDRKLAACAARKAGSYFMEHNQGGSGGWSAGVSLAALSVSYSGSSGMTLQKSAEYDYL